MTEDLDKNELEAKEHFFCGLDHFLNSRWADAEVEFRKSLSLLPNRVSTLTNLSAVLLKQKRLSESRTLLDTALTIDPNNPELRLNRGLVLFEERNYTAALDYYDRAIQLKPDYAEAWNNRGIVLGDLNRHTEALHGFETAIEINRSYAEAWYNRGVILFDLDRHVDALMSYTRAIELKADYAEAWRNRAAVLSRLDRHEESLAGYCRAMKLEPDADYLLGDLLHAQMRLCEWADFDGRCRTLRSRLLAGDLVSTPFGVLGLFDAPPLQRQCAELYAKNKLGLESEIEPITKKIRADKIRVGYFSMNFHEHAVAYLVAELIECHDRNKFEIYGFSFGVNSGDAMRKRLEGAFDKFLEVSLISELDTARLARDHEIDIAIDLGGYTQDSRPAIFAHRGAPIQINYLGFPGTMGSPAIDYLIADPVLISEDLRDAYSEKIIYLPNSYQVNDSKRDISDRVFTRQGLGLPESGFVFCCFNNNWKILPETFDIWVRIMQSVPNSVLWLYEDNPAAARNLQAQAVRQKLDPNRLVFARRMPHAEHLARYRLADLFLDTFPYGAHTTGSDALWAGLPVLTRSGQSFASRVAASLLHAVGLPELITKTAKDYESLAVELASNTDRIASLKVKLTNNRATCPLFNTPLFTKHIESAYQTTYDRYHAGLAPNHICVNP